MANVAFDIYTLVNSANLLTGFTGSVGVIEETPDEYVSFFQAPGDAPSRLYDSTYAQTEYSGLMAQVRSKSYVTAQEKIDAIYQFLDRHAGWDVSGVHYYSVFAKSHPSYLKRDSQGRSVFVVNFKVIFQRTI